MLALDKPLIQEVRPVDPHLLEGEGVTRKQATAVLELAGRGLLAELERIAQPVGSGFTQ